MRRHWRASRLGWGGRHDFIMESCWRRFRLRQARRGGGAWGVRRRRCSPLAPSFGPARTFSGSHTAGALLPARARWEGTLAAPPGHGNSRSRAAQGSAVTGPSTPPTTPSTPATGRARAALELSLRHGGFVSTSAALRGHDRQRPKSHPSRPCWDWARIHLPLGRPHWPRRPGGRLTPSPSLSQSFVLLSITCPSVLV